MYIPIHNNFKCQHTNALIKRYRQTGFKKKKEEPTKCCLQEAHFRVKDIQIENEGLKKYISCKCNDKKEWVLIFILDKIDFEIGHKERQQRA